MAAPPSQRKKRAANFDSAEIRLLVDLVVEYKNVLENKRSDAVTWNEKSLAWNELATIFNSTSGIKCHRTAEVLRSKYETIKKELRKKAANMKKEIFLTGGSPVITIPKYMDFEEKLLGIISMSVEGLPSVGDSESHLSRQGEIISANLAENVPEEIEFIEVLEMQPIGSHERETTLDSTNITPVVIPVLADNSTELIISDSVIQTPGMNWKPDSLKSQKSAQVHVKRRPTHSAQETFSKLAEARNELVILQHNVQKADADFKIQENDLKLRILQEELKQKIQKNINDEEIHRKTVEIHAKTLELLEKQIEEQNLKIEILELQRKL